MDIELEPGKYVVAVSGGVDSVVLLDALQTKPGVELIVAHFDHGIREDSGEDREFVQSLADKYGLPFEYNEGGLGQDASEATARNARYEFLEKTSKRHEARAIVTAHHQDDLLETAIINLLRGTGRKGLSSLSDRPGLRRPLLSIPKSQLIDYAAKNNLEWREDSTNSDESYLRNYVRLRILPKFGSESRQNFLQLIEQAHGNNKELDAFLASLIRSQDSLDRRWFNRLSHEVSLEVMAAWLRKHGIRNFDRITLERLVVAAKTGRAGQRFDVINGNIIRIEKTYLALEALER